VNEKEVLARYRRLQAWVRRERRRLERTRERPSQVYLRRARLLVDMDHLSLRELLRELLAMGR
jgi:hypothetical protein